MEKKNNILDIIKDKVSKSDSTSLIENSKWEKYDDQTIPAGIKNLDLSAV